MVHKTENNCF